MAQSVFFDRGETGRALRPDLLVALSLAVLLSAGWAMTDWSRLSRMLLPDSDDMMRLVQVRDWLAGQGTNDWTQYRLAPPQGAPMHWSRINDLGIAAVILAMNPWVGQANAELAAVLAYPAVLFACALFLSARIARQLWGASAGPVAAVLTALAYPGTTVFAPGRIDHHALQVVLIQLLVLCLMRAPSLRTGAAAGAITGVSLAVGLETTPQIAALLAVLALLWLVNGITERACLAGFAAGLGASTLVLLTFLRPTYWPAQLCDAFTPASATAALALAGALGVLAAGTPHLADRRTRLVGGTGLGALTLGAVLLAFPNCLSGPYGEVDPFLREAFFTHIDEANGILSQPGLARIIAVGGVLTAASAASGWMLFRARERWPLCLPIASVVLVSAGIMLFQVRGTYIGAPLGAPVLAGLVMAARRRTTKQLLGVVAAWLASSGLAYATIPERIGTLAASPDHRAIQQAKVHVLCSAGDSWEQIGRYDPGVVMASTSVSAYLLAATRHSTVGASYHRNNAGNMAMYRFFLDPPDRSLQIAREWRVGYVIFCPGDFSELDVTRKYPNSLATGLEHRHVPTWLQPLPLSGTRLRLYRIR